MKCNLCGSDAEVIDRNHVGYLEGRNFDIYSCSFCDSQFVKPVDFSTEIYQSIYQNAEITPGYNRYFYYTKAIKEQADPLGFLASLESMYWSVQRFLKQYSKTDTKILEVGSGFGYLTFAMHKSGYDVKGIDIAASAVAEAKRKFGDLYICADIFEYHKRHEATYDLIILTEVIEHIEEPVAFIEALLKMLKPNGAILITTPNKSVYPESAIWDTDLPPVHLWWFSEGSAAYMAKILGCEIEFTDFTAFNRNNFVKPRYKFFKSNKDSSRLKKDGSVAFPQVWKSPRNISAPKATAQKIFTKIATISLLDSLLTKESFPIHKSTTMTFVLKKRE